MKNFIDVNIVVDSKASITHTELYVNFREWFEENFTNHITPGKIKVKEYLIRLWGEPKRNSWNGRRLSTLMDKLDRDVGIVLDNEDIL